MSKILVIDDEQPLRENLLQLLEFEGYEPIGARDGYEGIRLAQEHLPDLVICDIAMPELDGYEVLAQLHALPVTAAIPVIFLSARTSQEAIKRGLAIGAAHYLTKPFRFTTLLDAIESQLG